MYQKCSTYTTQSVHINMHKGPTYTACMTKQYIVRLIYYLGYVIIAIYYIYIARYNVVLPVRVSRLLACAVGS